MLLGVVLRTDVVAVPRHARVGRILAVSGRHRRLLTVDVDAEIDVGLRLRRRGGLGRGGLGRDRLGDGLGRGRRRLGGRSDHRSNRRPTGDTRVRLGRCLAVRARAQLRDHVAVASHVLAERDRDVGLPAALGNGAGAVGTGSGDVRLGVQVHVNACQVPNDDHLARDEGLGNAEPEVVRAGMLLLMRQRADVERLLPTARTFARVAGEGTPRVLELAVRPVAAPCTGVREHRNICSLADPAALALSRQLRDERLGEAVCLDVAEDRDPASVDVAGRSLDTSGADRGRRGRAKRRRLGLRAVPGPAYRDHGPVGGAQAPRAGAGQAVPAPAELLRPAAPRRDPESRHQRHR